MPIGCRLLAWFTMVMGFILMILCAIGLVIFDEWLLRLACLGVAAVAIGAFTYGEEIILALK